MNSIEPFPIEKAIMYRITTEIASEPLFTQTAIETRKMPNPCAIKARPYVNLLFIFAVKIDMRAPTTMKIPISNVIIGPLPEMSSKSCVEKNNRILIPPSYLKKLRKHPRKNLTRYLLVKSSFKECSLRCKATSLFFKWI